MKRNKRKTLLRITEELRQRMRQRAVRKRKGRGAYTRKEKHASRYSPPTTRRLVA